MSREWEQFDRVLMQFARKDSLQFHYVYRMQWLDRMQLMYAN